VVCFIVISWNSSAETEATFTVATKLTCSMCREDPAPLVIGFVFPTGFIDRGFPKSGAV